MTEAFRQALRMTKPERAAMIDTGFFNDIIQAYARISAADAGLNAEQTAELMRCVSENLDELTAQEAVNKARGNRE